jgi:uncharacterized glyoxalase superfamily protein PhnB
MVDRVVPMIHVLDVRATVEWYQSIGFEVVETFGDGCGGLSFAILSFGSSQVMFNQDGQPSASARREVDLYVYTERVDDLHVHLKDRVEIVEPPHDTFYGMREFIIRDLNRFWITFGQASAAAALINGVRAGDAAAVGAVLDDASLTPKTLTAALVAASAGDDRNSAIVELLERAGAVPPPAVDAETLRSYAGEYESEQGLKASVAVRNGVLSVALAGQPPLSLVAVETTTFKPLALNGTITFNVDGTGTTGLSFTQGSTTIRLRRVNGTK